VMRWVSPWGSAWGLVSASLSESGMLWALASALASGTVSLRRAFGLARKLAPLAARRRL